MASKLICQQNLAGTDMRLFIILTDLTYYEYSYILLLGTLKFEFHMMHNSHWGFYRIYFKTKKIFFKFWNTSGLREYNEEFGICAYFLQLPPMGRTHGVKQPTEDYDKFLRISDNIWLVWSWIYNPCPGLLKMLFPKENW